MAFSYLGKCLDRTGAHRPLEVSGLVAELDEAGLAGKIWHACSFRSLAVRVASRKEGYLLSFRWHRTGGLCPSRGPGVPCEPEPDNTLAPAGKYRARIVDNFV